MNGPCKEPLGRPPEVPTVVTTVPPDEGEGKGGVEGRVGKGGNAEPVFPGEGEGGVEGGVEGGLEGVVELTSM